MPRHSQLPIAPSAEVFLLGQIDFERCLALQQRLVYEASGRTDGQISLLLGEHPQVVTIGRLGSRSHIRLSTRELESRRVEVRWVGRGGGCLVHMPGQLAIYPIVPLAWYGYRVGEYLERLRTGMLSVLADFQIHGERTAGSYDIEGRTGRLVAVAAAVKSWTTYFGAYLNVAPAGSLLRAVDAHDRPQHAMSSLLVERGRPLRMQGVRASVIRHLTEALGCTRHHIYTGHPLLAGGAARVYEPSAV